MAAASFPGLMSPQGAVQEMEIPAAMSVGFVEGKAYPGIAIWAVFQLPLKCCQMLLGFTHRECVTKRGKYPELSPCVSEVPSSALLGSASVRAAEPCLGWPRAGLRGASASASLPLLPCPASSPALGCDCLGKMLFGVAGHAVNEEVFLCILGIFLNGMFRQC